MRYHGVDFLGFIMVGVCSPSWLYRFMGFVVSGGLFFFFFLLYWANFQPYLF